MKLINVDKERFYKFIETHNLKMVEGDIFHSHYYVNEDGEKLAYRATSSWNPNVIYKIMGEENEETLNLVGEIFSEKLKY
jgi:hypothetical protein